MATRDVALEAMEEAHAGMVVESDHMEDMVAMEQASVVMEAVVSEVVVALAAALEDVETTVAAAAMVDMDVASADTVAMAEAVAMVEAAVMVEAVATVAVVVTEAAVTTMGHNNVNRAITVTATLA